MGDTFLEAWPAQPMAGLMRHERTHFSGGLAGVTYGRSRGTHFCRPGWRNFWPVSGGTSLGAWPAQPIWLASGDKVPQSWPAQPMAAWPGDTFLAAWLAQPTAALGRHIFGGQAGATFGQFRWDTFLATWLAQHMASLRVHIVCRPATETYGQSWGTFF